MSYHTTKKNWEGLAKRDPLWAICTHPDKKAEHWEVEDFFQTGEREVKILFDYLNLENYLLPDYETVLDFGCGVGRILRALYPEFQSLYGIDISETMIQNARHLNKEYLDKITFSEYDGTGIPWFEDNSLSFVISIIVLQHIPSNQAYKMIGELFRVLKPNGLLVFQALTRDIRQRSLFARIKSFLRIGERLALAGLGNRYHMEMNVLDKQEIRHLVEKHNSTILDIRISNHTDPAFDGNIKFIEEAESIDFISSLFIVRKNSK